MKYIFSLFSFLVLMGNPVTSQASDKVLDSRLYESAEHGDTISVQELIDNGANVNAKTRYGWTALHAAAYGGHTDTVQLLLKNGANTRSLTNRKETPARVALLNNKLNAAKLIDPSCTSMNTSYLLHEPYEDVVLSADYLFRKKSIR